MVGFAELAYGKPRSTHPTIPLMYNDERWLVGTTKSQFSLPKYLSPFPFLLFPNYLKSISL